MIFLFQILDASLIANEVLNSILKSKDKGVLWKLDIEKAYDHLNWTLLFSIMNRMGFGKKMDSSIPLFACAGNRGSVQTH